LAEEPPAATRVTLSVANTDTESWMQIAPSCTDA
jgi:hypothetical protein